MQRILRLIFAIGMLYRPRTFSNLFQTFDRDSRIMWHVLENLSHNKIQKMFPCIFKYFRKPLYFEAIKGRL